MVTARDLSQCAREMNGEQTAVTVVVKWGNVAEQVVETECALKTSGQQVYATARRVSSEHSVITLTLTRPGRSYGQLIICHHCHQRACDGAHFQAV